ncbi:hypothetical protein AUP68_09928 [Ilyonectria robusta]
MPQSSHPDLAMLKNTIQKQFGHADDLTTTNLRKQDEVVLQTCRGEGALNADEFFDLLGDVRGEDALETCQGEGAPTVDKFFDLAQRGTIS